MRMQEMPGRRGMERTPRNRKELIRRKTQEAFRGRLEEKDFIGRPPYNRADIEADLALVAEEEARHKRVDTPQDIENLEVAELFEAVVLWNSEQAEWLGGRATTIKTSKYDDYINGIDMLVEFREERSASHLGLSADVTFSGDPRIIAKKFAHLRAKIKEGVLSQIKYFHSDRTNFDGQLSKVPEVVIGVGRRMVEELGNLWVDGKNKALAEHRAGVMILWQMEAELKVFAGYAKSIGQHEAERIYRDRLALIQGILKKKAELVARVEKEGYEDPTHLAIMQFARNWNRY